MEGTLRGTVRLFDRQLAANRRAKNAFTLLQERFRDDIYTYLDCILGERYSERCWNEVWTHVYSDSEGYGDANRVELFRLATAFAGISPGSQRQVKGSLPLLLPFDERVATVLRDRFDFCYADIAKIMCLDTYTDVAPLLIRGRETANALHAAMVHESMVTQSALASA